MWLLLVLVTQKHGKETATNIIYSTDVRTTVRWIADEDPQNILEPPTDGGYLCSNFLSILIIFSVLMTQHVV